MFELRVVRNRSAGNGVLNLRRATLGGDMDLGIAGRKAIVCASSRGLGHGCSRFIRAETVLIDGGAYPSAF
jgi:hypothetical protein